MHTIENSSHMKYFRAFLLFSKEIGTINTCMFNQLLFVWLSVAYFCVVILNLAPQIYMKIIAGNHFSSSNKGLPSETYGCRRQGAFT